jgi:hypothetical protein
MLKARSTNSVKAGVLAFVPEEFEPVPLPSAPSKRVGGSRFPRFRSSAAESTTIELCSVSVEQNSNPDLSGLAPI